MIDLIALFKSAEDGDGVLNRRLIYLNGLEPAFERRVLFDVLAVLVKGRCADAVQLTAREHGL